MKKTGTQKYCPICREITETHVLPEGYRQMTYRGVPVKRRKLVWGRNRQGHGGCGWEWYTYEIPETVLGDAFSGDGSKSDRKRNERKTRKGK
jgi:hypothetical protein